MIWWRLEGTIPDAPTRSAALQLRRQILQLIALIVVAGVVFAVTRAVAASNRDMNRQDAMAWYARGQRALADHRFSDAVDAFRHATARNRDNRNFALALAGALALNGDGEAARTALLTLRESSPEDVDINLQLARLAAARDDVGEAVRFYRTALYAPWSADHLDARRAVRLELVRFLLAHDATAQADAELIAFTSSLPADPMLHLEAARLFVGADDQAHALEQFEAALRLAPDNRDALAGAGTAAFHLRNYPLAQRYLRRTPAGSPEVRRDRAVVDLVLSRDPLADRIGSTERRRRFEAVLAYVRERLSACLSARAQDGATDEQALLTELEDLTQQLPSRGPVDQDLIEAGMDVIRRIETKVIADCGPAMIMDDALLRIGEMHGGEP
jgi:tetratricopeptide (TPR) repeat protein